MTQQDLTQLDFIKLGFLAAAARGLYIAPSPSSGRLGKAGTKKRHNYIVSDDKGLLWGSGVTVDQAIDQAFDLILAGKEGSKQ